MYHEKLIAYQEGLALAVLLGERSDAQVRTNYAIKDQINRASLSIPLNIAEGSARSSSRDRAHFYVIARASAAECAALVDVMHKRKFIDATEFAALKTKCNQVSTLLYKMIQSTRAQINKEPRNQGDQGTKELRQLG